MNFCSLFEAEFKKFTKFRAPKIAKNRSFRTSGFSKIDFMENLSNRKILQVPHCAQIKISDFKWNYIQRQISKKYIFF